MSTGTVIQIIGAVIDVEFPKDNLPRIYDALEVEEKWLGFRSSAATGRRYRKNDCHGCIGRLEKRRSR